MKTALLATIFLLVGCSRPFQIGGGRQVESIKIEPVKKSVYRVERYV